MISKNYLSTLQIVRDIGGYSLGRADIVRRAMGKKKMDVMEEERRNFIYGQTDKEGNIVINGAIRNGVDEKSASDIYDLMIDFANYAFNKSHSAAYAVVAFRTAWLKCYYPVEFMAALISSIMGDTTSVSLYVQECKRLNIEILPPDINKSYDKFTVDKGRIRFGLSAVKNVGSNFIQDIISAREKAGEFTSLTDFIERVIREDNNSINKRAVESLIKCGALDFLGVKRAQLLAVYEKTIEGINADRKRNISGQFSIFDSVDSKKLEDNYPDLREFPKNILLSMEKEMVGIYLSGHPLEEYEDRLKKISNITVYDILHKEDLDPGLSRIRDGMRVRIGGIIVEKKNKITKNNNMMAFLKFEDLYGVIECIVFPKTYDEYNELLKEDSIVILRGRVSLSEVEEAKLIVEKIEPLEVEKTEKIYLKVSNRSFKDTFALITDVLRRNKGNTPVYVYIEQEEKMVVADRSLWVENSNNTIYELEKLLGRDSVKISS